MPRRRPSTLSTEDQRAVLRREIEAELEARDLAPWESAMCRWLARNPTTKGDRQCLVASALAGRDVSWDEMETLKTRPQWKALRRSERAEIQQDVKEALDTLQSLAPKAAEVQRKALEVLDTELTTGVDKMSAVRAVPPVVNPITERVWPKTDGLNVNVARTITLTAYQQAGLDSPPIIVEAEAIPMVQNAAGEWTPDPSYAAAGATSSVVPRIATGGTE